MTPTDGELQVVLCTAPDAEVASTLAEALVEERLAACVSVVGSVRSVYRWQGAVHSDDEVLLVIKTCGERLAALAERIQALHPYDLPEVIALPVSGGSSAYLDWVRGECSE